jgi:GNAT superfamily N-acetyltransferase
MTIHLRPLDPGTDLPAVVDLVNTNGFSETSTTVTLLREQERQTPEGLVRYRTVATDQAGQIIGLGTAFRRSVLKEGLFLVTTAVNSADERRGVGSRLLEDVVTFVTKHGGRQLAAIVKDDCPACLRFAQRHGFRIDRHQFQSRLTLDDFNQDRFSGLVERVETTGIRFLTLADVGDTPEARYAYYQLQVRLVVDVPGNTDVMQQPPSFADFSQALFEGQRYRAAAQFIAADGNRWIGLACLLVPPQGGPLYNRFTGVERDYRGRNVALALKLLAIRYARSLNAPAVETHNDSLNASMLAVNTKLGYQAQPGSYILARTL